VTRYRGRGKNGHNFNIRHKLTNLLLFYKFSIIVKIKKKKKFSKSCQKTVKKLSKMSKMSKGCQKVVKNCQKNFQKVFKKLSKSCQKFFKKGKNCKFLK
jgi:hypothetical protein